MDTTVNLIKKYILNNSDPYLNTNKVDIDYSYGSGKRLIYILNLLKKKYNINFIIEVGSLYGNSAITMRNIFNNVIILCIDTFLGDVNIRLGIDKKGVEKSWGMLYNGYKPIMIQQFLNNIISTNNTENIFPFVISSIVGLKSIKRLIKFKNFKNPDLIYLDSSHEEGETYLEIIHSWNLLKSNGILLGDDFNWKGVKNDVIKFSKSHSDEIKIDQDFNNDDKLLFNHNFYVYPKNKPVVWFFFKK